MSFDPVAFFAAHAARHLAAGPHDDAWTAASEVFNRFYPFGMPMEEYARKTLCQARRAKGAPEREMLEGLARFRIVDRVIAGELGGVTADERERLRKLRDAWRARGPAKECPARRRPAPGSVVVARCGRAPYTISNVRWAGPHVEQRWMHEDCLEALVSRLAAEPPGEPLVIAVAGRPRFSPGGLAFSGRERLAVCFPDRTETVDPGRVLGLARRLGDAHPEPRTVFSFWHLCRERALTSDIAPIDRRLVGLAADWRQDTAELHALFLPATKLEIGAALRRLEA